MLLLKSCNKKLFDHEQTNPEGCAVLIFSKCHGEKKAWENSRITVLKDQRDDNWGM
jgi:hypothetical protein